MHRPETPGDTGNRLARQLGLFDSTMIMVGIVIGSGIFLTTGIMATSLPSSGWLLLAWLAGGCVTLAGALVYAELGAALPEAGGQYVYLREAYGPLIAFLNGWVIFLVYMGAGIALLALAFAEYFGAFLPALSTGAILFRPGFLTISAGQLVAVALIVLFSAANYAGVVIGKTVQNVLTVTKVGAILLLIVFGLLSDHGVAFELSFDRGAMPPGQLLAGLGTGLIAVFWAFDGWNNVNLVAGEIKQPARNLPLALIIGTAVIAIIYLLVNVVYLRALPFTEMAGVITIANAAATVLFGDTAMHLLAVAILISIAGSTNGSVLVGARVYYAMARDGLFFRRMATVHPRFGTPSVAIAAQAAWSSLLALTGTLTQLFTYFIVSTLLFWIATVVAVFVLRQKRPDLPRPYKTWGYPVTPLIFILACGGVLVNALFESPVESLAGLGITALGIPVYFYWRQRSRNAAQS